MGSDSTRALLFVCISKVVSGRARIEEPAERTSLIKGRPPPAALINGLCGRPPYRDTNEALFSAQPVTSAALSSLGSRWRCRVRTGTSESNNFAEHIVAFVAMESVLFSNPSYAAIG